MNMVKTFFLMALMTALMVAIGGLLGGSMWATIMLIFSIGMNLISYWFSDSIVLKTYGAREVDENTAPQIYNLVADLSEKAELPMPRVYIIDSDVPNAFATGRNPDNAAVAVTTGIMKTLDYNEMAGVLGHELAHVKHRDILTG
ncbi:MAG: M48 family metalloprotease, partial [Selenomonadaceae bacterium]|nr:M48 family metalloprotease [Selenomonadaceae bacterium]